jgi:hypothetical protein
MWTKSDCKTWQGQEDSNPRPTVLETGTLPTELYPCATTLLYHKKSENASAFFEKKKIFILPLPVTCSEAVSFINFASAFQFTQKSQLTIEKSIKI